MGDGGEQTPYRPLLHSNMEEKFQKRHRREPQQQQRGQEGDWAGRREEPVGQEEPAVHAHSGPTQSKLRQKAPLRLTVSFSS